MFTGKYLFNFKAANQLLSGTDLGFSRRAVWHAKQIYSWVPMSILSANEVQKTEVANLLHRKMQHVSGITVSQFSQFIVRAKACENLPSQSRYPFHIDFRSDPADDPSRTRHASGRYTSRVPRTVIGCCITFQ